ncbi:SpaA isopeptide-forming pilin-related protein [Erysipelothrix anatis]|uniref:SpaA isopeptide-forming pilin-related protein n=1 Tax=Erysipelothrix anatis TaxID=2683713 RepID=UPI001A9FCDB2|nr:SpaA isopeptide-forming pilin-related protein [Erysipelothrix anatis]
MPVIEEVPANKKVFGLYTNQEWQLGDITLPADSLIEIVTVEDGTAVLEDVCLPQGFYYFKELDAGETHTLLDRHYEFEYTAQGHDTIQEIVLYEKEETPLLNKLHFNSFSLKKLNEEATLTELEGYSFEYKDSKGAIFSLEKEDGAIIQTVTVNAESLATFNYIPVGIFYLKEQKPSSSNHLLSETIYRIESTKDGIQVFDEADKLIAEQTVLEEALFLFEVKNHLVKGTGQLTKTDISTGDPLPNTGIRLLDENMTIIYEGRTNDKGILVFDELPKGNYYFQEFEAPSDYQIDETPIPFEIKNDGEVVKCEMKNKQIPKATLPKTGEDSSIKLYVAGVLVSLGAIAMLHYKRKTKKLNNDN